MEVAEAGADVRDRTTGPLPAETTSARGPLCMSHAKIAGDLTNQDLDWGSSEQSALEETSEPEIADTGVDALNRSTTFDSSVQFDGTSDPYNVSEETESEFRVRLMNWIEQMMFVSGETAEPSTETTGMIEEIVRAQVIEMVSVEIWTPWSTTLYTISWFR